MFSAVGERENHATVRHVAKRKTVAKIVQRLNIPPNWKAKNMSNTTDYYCKQTAAPVHAVVTPPGSKSITNRALLCAALAEGTSHLSGVLDSEDTQVMIEALRQLGIPVTRHLETAALKITGDGGNLPVKNADIYVGNSGTTARFLTAMLATTHGGNYRIYGKPRMHERPIRDLCDALRSLGADVRTESGNGCPPVLVGPNGTLSGETRISGQISSQFLSAVLMAAPVSPDGITLHVEGELVSKPYIKMTLEVMNRFGGTVETPGDFSRFHIPVRSKYFPRNYAIEPDASAASYFFAAAAVTGGSVTVQGLTRESLQGDVEFCTALQAMGCDVEYGSGFIKVAGKPLHGITIDMNAVSDTVMTLGAAALFAEGATQITNVAHIRHKETDRIAALACELRKLGADVEEKEDGLKITPVPPLHGAVIDTYDDHRMAMSFAVAGLKIPDVVIRNPDCTAKTYPGFFTDWEKMIRTGI
ncbi:MAG: 3-phosphoshikimate 1-carboxyvinyltransferase [Planctomycetaceae bacterium]|nr:3-phosphoshikimate 1-carboxyvinyltransferase [Planctomycetaceae bacterium]